MKSKKKCLTKIFFCFILKYLDDSTNLRWLDVSAQFYIFILFAYGETIGSSWFRESVIWSGISTPSVHSTLSYCFILRWLFNFSVDATRHRDLSQLPCPRTILIVFKSYKNSHIGPLRHQILKSPRRSKFFLAKYKLFLTDRLSWSYVLSTSRVFWLSFPHF